MSEDKQLVENYLKTAFESGSIKIVEFQLNALCNLNCTYCYYNKSLNQSTHKNDEEILLNLDAILEYLHRNRFLDKVGNLDIFSGEPLIQNVGIKSIKKLIDFIHKNNLNLPVLIPSNGTFVNYDSKIQEVENLIDYARNKNVRVGISLSFDGKYMDYVNRSGINYTDEYYEKLFAFAKKHGCGFHPMVYYNNIEKWIDNFLWFQDMFKKYDIPWWSVYFLEVRNDGWNYKNSSEFKKFIKFVLNWVFSNIFNHDRDSFINNFVFKSKRSMNIFNNFSKHNRGIGCSIQHSLQIRLLDLAVNPCHRLSYNELDSFKFTKDKDNKIVDIDPLNIGMHFAIKHYDKKNAPFCQDCMINELCSGGCLGSQFEVNNDPFIPIQSVCIVEHAKLAGQLEFFRENNLLRDVINKLDNKKSAALIEINNNL